MVEPGQHAPTGASPDPDGPPAGSGRAARVGLAAASVAAVLLVACGGDDGGESVTAGDQSDEQAGQAGGESPDNQSTCLVDAETASEAVGRELADDGLTMGGAGAAGGEASFDSDGAEAAMDEGAFSVGWLGCVFTADDGAEYMVGELVDEDGDPDISGFEQLARRGRAGSRRDRRGGRTRGR